MRASTRIVIAGLLATFIVSSVGAASASTTTIRGAVFYNDRRTDGLFEARRDKSKDPGQRCDASGQRDGTNTPCRPNWLGGKYMVVDVIERDLYIPAREAPAACKTEEISTFQSQPDDSGFEWVSGKTPAHVCSSEMTFRTNGV
jgi:hypothetical protein